jgi:hypothetical protein
MAAADADAVGKAIATAHYSEPLLTLATKHGMADRVVTVRLEAASDGTIFNCEIQSPKDLPAAFQTDLLSKIRTWSFSFLKKPSFCTVELKFRPATQPAPATTQAAPAAAEIDALIQKLGAESYAERERAQIQLTEIGQPALAALEKARRVTDPEVVSRANAAWEAIKFSGAPDIAQLENSKITVGEVPALGLEHLIQLSNLRRDADLAAHDRQTTPEGRTLQKWIDAARRELTYRGYTSVDNDHMRRPDGTEIPLR